MVFFVVFSVFSGTGDSQRDSRESFAIETPISIARQADFARITRISDSPESPDSRESCESIGTNHATKSRSFPRILWVRQGQKIL